MKREQLNNNTSNTTWPWHLLVIKRSPAKGTEMSPPPPTSPRPQCLPESAGALSRPFVGETLCRCNDQTPLAGSGEHEIAGDTFVPSKICVVIRAAEPRPSRCALRQRDARRRRCRKWWTRAVSARVGARQLQRGRGARPVTLRTAMSTASTESLKKATGRRSAVMRRQ